MLYFEHDQDHYLVWPALAVGIRGEFWIGLGWLNFEFGWRNGDGGEHDSTAIQGAAMKVIIATIIVAVGVAIGRYFAEFVWALGRMS